jgi:hypothetical protein
VAVDGVEVAGLAEAAHAQVSGAHAADAGEESQRVRVSVEHGDQRRRPVGREGGVEDPVLARLLPRAGLDGVEQQAGTGPDDVDGGAQRVEPVGRGQGLGDDGAHGGDGDRGRVGGPPDRVGACDDLAATTFAGGGVGGHGGEGLLDRSGGQTQVGRCAVGSPQPGQRGEQRPLDVDRERGLVGDAARLFQSDRRRGDRLMRPAFRGEGHPRRSADQDRLAARVDAVGPRLQCPLDEGVVQDTDREQGLAPTAPGSAELAQQADEVALRDALYDALGERTRAG